MLIKVCETCGEKLDIDEIQSGDVVCRKCIYKWEKESGVCNEGDYT